MTAHFKEFNKSNVHLSKRRCETKLLEIERRLKISVSTQIHETSRALELLKGSLGCIREIDADFNRIDNKCQKCRSCLPQFEQIKKLSLARHNLNIVKKIGKLFGEVPIKAKHLLKLLNRNPDKYLFYIYQNLRKLVKLRDETLSKGLKYMTQGNSNRDNGEQEMKNHFKLIDKVILNLEKQVRMNVSDALYLAVKQPEILVETLKICESEDRCNYKILCYSINDWNTWREEEEKDKEDDDYPLPSINDKDTMCSKVKSEIETSIIRVIEKLQLEKTEKGLNEFLHAIDENMKDLHDVNEYLRVTFPPHYQIAKYYVETYYNILQSLILHQLDIDEVPTQERLFVVTWIAKFKMAINNLEKKMAKYGDDNGNKTDKMINNLSDLENSLLSSYIATWKQKSNLWIRNIVETESKKQEYFTVDNIPRTHCVQDLFAAINHQFTIATEKLKGETFINVIIMILEAMDEFELLLKSYINSHWKSFDDKYFCAVINSGYDVTQKLNAKLRAISTNPHIYGIDDKEYAKLEDCFDGTIRKFTNMGKECGSLLAQKIYDDALKENIFEHLFTDNYFDNKSDKNEYMESTVETLQDYFDDFKRWINEPYFFWELVKGMMGIITSGYMEAILSNKPNVDCEELANYIRNDVKILDEYFGDPDEFNIICKLWNEKITVLQAIHGALECEDGFFDLFSKSIKNDNQYGPKLSQYIIKLKQKQDIKQIPKIKNSKAVKWINGKIQNKENH